MAQHHIEFKSKNIEIEEIKFFFLQFIKNKNSRRSSIRVVNERK